MKTKMQKRYKKLLQMINIGMDEYCHSSPNCDCCDDDCYLQRLIDGKVNVMNVDICPNVKMSKEDEDFLEELEKFEKNMEEMI
jgi:hypothetical protein